jgi:hypothetical protein
MPFRRLALLLAATAAANAFAWGGDGHSIVAEIASRRLTPEARAEMERLLGPGVSLASISNWADDIRGARPETYNLHFVDIPVKEDAYVRDVHCKASPKGDCIVAELDRERAVLACSANDAARREALRFATHFIGDMHQPLHTVDEARGGNDIKLDVDIRNAKCPRCTPRRTSENLHQVWDSSLITATVWNWGAYVDRLEQGWLGSPAARSADAGGVLEWMIESHKVATTFWDWTPADKLVGDDYYQKVLPQLDKQLGLGGLRLARFLNETLPRNKPSSGCAS